MRGRAAGCGHPALRITRSTCGRGVGDAAPYGGKARGAADDERDDVGIAPYGGCGGAVRGRAAAHMGAALQGITGGAVQVGGVEPRPYAGQGVRCGGRTDCRVAALFAMTVFLGRCGAWSGGGVWSPRPTDNKKYLRAGRRGRRPLRRQSKRCGG